MWGGGVVGPMRTAAVFPPRVQDFGIAVELFLAVAFVHLVVRAAEPQRERPPRAGGHRVLRHVRPEMRGTLWARIEVSQPAQESFDPNHLFVRRFVGEVCRQRVEQCPARLPERLPRRIFEMPDFWGETPDF